MIDSWRASLAEMIGAFIITFTAAGAICLDARTNGELGLVGIALAYGLSIFIAMTAFARVSGGHFNPAITVALLLAKRIALRDAIAWIAAQLVGATLAAFTLATIVPAASTSLVHLGTPQLSDGISRLAAIRVEGIFSFMMATVFLMAARDGRAANAASALAVSFTAIVGVITAGPLSGAALNPARAFGPAFVGGYWSSHVVYWVGPMLGALLAAALAGVAFARQ